MATVYVLSGRQGFGNTDYGYYEDIEVWDVYHNFEDAENAFKNIVLSVAKFLNGILDNFVYTEENLFQDNEPTADEFGWDCIIGENRRRWELVPPEEDDDYNEGTWFFPIVELCTYEVR